MKHTELENLNTVRLPLSDQIFRVLFSIQNDLFITKMFQISKKYEQEMEEFLESSQKKMAIASSMMI